MSLSDKFTRVITASESMVGIAGSHAHQDYCPLATNRSRCSMLSCPSR